MHVRIGEIRHMNVAAHVGGGVVGAKNCYVLPFCRGGVHGETLLSTHRVPT
jgi:hypothetical protein